MCITERKEIETAKDDMVFFKVVRERNGKLEPLYRGARGKERGYDFHGIKEDSEFDFLKQIENPAVGWEYGFGYCCFPSYEDAKKYKIFSGTGDKLIVSVMVKSSTKYQVGSISIYDYSCGRGVKLLAVRAERIEYVGKA